MHEATKQILSKLEYEYSDKTIVIVEGYTNRKSAL